MAGITILDGPMGTELARRGVDTSGPRWSARAVEEAPAAVEAIHRDYAAAGASIHTAATFRAQPRIVPDRWESLARHAVALARAGAKPGDLVAGGIAPLADCYRPDLSPAETDPTATRAEHARLARVLVDAGCDVLLCETFAHAGEALLAVEASLAAAATAAGHSPRVWLSLTPGYRADLLTPAAVGECARNAIGLGVDAVLVNCAPVRATLGYIQELARSIGGGPARIGAYANAGRDDRGWMTSPASIATYLDAARGWINAGVSIIGSCCGTTPDFTRALSELAGRTQGAPAPD